eukprot:4355172-Prymnesium_polylepis.1
MAEIIHNRKQTVRHALSRQAQGWGRLRGKSLDLTGGIAAQAVCCAYCGPNLLMCNLKRLESHRRHVARLDDQHGAIHENQRQLDEPHERAILAPGDGGWYERQRTTGGLVHRPWPHLLWGCIAKCRDKKETLTRRAKSTRACSNSSLIRSTQPSAIILHDATTTKEGHEHREARASQTREPLLSHALPVSVSLRHISSGSHMNAAGL